MSRFALRTRTEKILIPGAIIGVIVILTLLLTGNYGEGPRHQEQNNQNHSSIQD